MDEKDALNYLNKQIEFKKKDDLDKYLGHFVIVALMVVVFFGALTMPDRYDNLVSVFLITFGSLGIGYVFGFGRGKIEGAVK